MNGVLFRPRARARARWLASKLMQAGTQLDYVERLLRDLQVVGRQVDVLRELDQGWGQDAAAALGFGAMDSCLCELAGAIYRAANNPLVKGQPLYREKGVQGIRRVLAGELNSSIGWRVEELAGAAMTSMSVEAVLAQSAGWAMRRSAEQLRSRRLRAYVRHGFDLGLAEHVIGSLALIGVSLGQTASMVGRAKRRLHEEQRELGQRQGGAQLLSLYQ